MKEDKSPKVVITTRVPQEVKTKLEAAARKKFRTLSEIVAFILKNSVK
jgi:hypothetical protein